MKKNEKCRNLLKTAFSLVIIVSLLLLVESCKNASKQKKDDVSKEDVERKIEDAAQTTGQYLSEERQKIINDLENKIEKADDEIDKLSQQMASVSENVKEEYEETIKSLKARRDEAQKKADQLKKSSKEAWNKVEEGVENALNELNRSIEEAKSKFESD
jgi:predicted  nucleic acid-binding Zn-ribbon protein